jgi:hypothetical protein
MDDLSRLVTLDVPPSLAFRYREDFEDCPYPHKHEMQWVAQETEKMFEDAPFQLIRK